MLNLNTMVIISHTVGKVFLYIDCLRDCFHTPIGLINERDD